MKLARLHQGKALQFARLTRTCSERAKVELLLAI